MGNAVPDRYSFGSGITAGLDYLQPTVILDEFFVLFSAGTKLAPLLVRSVMPEDRLAPQGDVLYAVLGDHGGSKHVRMAFQLRSS